jgi:hypothetical protein
MTTLTLLTKIYNTHQLKQMDKTLGDLLGGLAIEATVTGTPANKWVQLDLEGEDEEIAANLLQRETALCPTSLSNVKKFASLKGYIANLQKNPDQLLLDVGIFEPKTVYATVPLKHLQAKLGQGKALSLKQLSELWGFSDNLPLNLKVLNVKPEENLLEAELQLKQVETLLNWRDSLLDRLIILGSPLYEVKAAVEQEGLSRDVIDYENLGMFEHALVCKLGTDAAGLIGRLGRRLRKSRFVVFNPKRVLAALEPPTLKA